MLNPGLGLFIVQNGNILDHFLTFSGIDSFVSSLQTPTQGRLKLSRMLRISVTLRVSKGVFLSRNGPLQALCDGEY